MFVPLTISFKSKLQIYTKSAKMLLIQRLLEQFISDKTAFFQCIIKKITYGYQNLAVFLTLLSFIQIKFAVNKCKLKQTKEKLNGMI